MRWTVETLEQGSNVEYHFKTKKAALAFVDKVTRRGFEVTGFYRYPY